MPANRLLTATCEDRAAKLDALEAGLAQPRPFSEAQLASLCVLGERMIHTELRMFDAERDVREATTQLHRNVDVVLPM